MSLQERTLVVKNFDPDKTTANLLKELCLQGGPVRNVVVKPDHAFIEYEDIESVGYSKALLEGVELFGKKLVMEPKTRKVSYFKHTQLLHDYIRYDKQQRNQQQQQQLLQQQQQQQQFQLQQQMIASFNQNPEQQAQYNNMPQPFEQNPNFPINFVSPQVVNNPVTTFQQASNNFFTGQNQQMPQLHQQIPSHQMLPPHQMPHPQQMPIESQFHQPNQQLQQSNLVQRPNDNMRRSRSFNHHQQYNTHQSNRNRRSSDWSTRRK